MALPRVAASVALKPSPAAVAELRRLQAELQRSERAQSQTSAAVLELRSKFEELSHSVAQVSRAQSSSSAPSSVERRSARRDVAAAQRRRAERAERALRRVVHAMCALTTGSEGGTMRVLCDQLEETKDEDKGAMFDACDTSTLLDAIGACAEREVDAARVRAIAQAASSPLPPADFQRRPPALHSPPGGLFASPPAKVVAVDESAQAEDTVRVSPLQRRRSPPLPPHLAAAAEQQQPQQQQQRRRQRQRTEPPDCLIVAAAAAQSARSAKVPSAATEAEAPRRVSPAPARAPAQLRGGAAVAVERIERVVDARDITSTHGAPLRQYLVHWERSSSTEDEWFDCESLMVTPEHAALVAVFVRGAARSSGEGTSR